jgi:hypothetical protein
MRKITIAVTCAALLGIGFPILSTSNADAQEVRFRVGEPTKKKVIIRHDNGRHMGFSHSRHYGYDRGGDGYARSTTVVKKRPGSTTIIKRRGD